MEYKHFNHEHNLAIFELQPGNEEINCSACQTLCSDSVYACWKCKFFLHLQCGNAIRAIEHPSHELHHLILLPYPTYSPGFFVCNACGASGSSFNYCCPMCEFDLHIQCALLPAIISHKAHHRHELTLSYGLVHANGSSSCGICHKVLDKKLWAYGCDHCNFHVHVGCARPEMVPVSFQAEEAKPRINGGESNEDGSRPAEVEDPALATQLELIRLQHELELSNQLAKMMASFNLSSLV